VQEGHGSIKLISHLNAVLGEDMMRVLTRQELWAVRLAPTVCPFSGAADESWAVIARQSGAMVADLPRWLRPPLRLGLGLGLGLGLACHGYFFFQPQRSR
jgi:hypothetical protein